MTETRTPAGRSLCGARNARSELEPLGAKKAEAERTLGDHYETIAVPLSKLRIRFEHTVWGHLGPVRAESRMSLTVKSRPDYCSLVPS